MNYGLGRLKDFPFSLRLIRKIHAILLEGCVVVTVLPGSFVRAKIGLAPQAAPWRRLCLSHRRLRDAPGP